MFKKRIWKPLLIGLGWTLSLAGLVVLMSFISIKKNEVVCSAIKVYIPGSHYFIDRQEVDHILQMDSHTLIGRRIETIDLHDLETKLKNNPFIEFAKVYADMDGVIQVEVSQRQPILRVMNRFDQDFYVDQHGLKMPLSQNFTARVIAANGFIDELFANKVDSLHTALARDLFKTADFIRNDSLWDAQIAQIYINKDHEIELIPRVGNQRILLGTADSLELRFGNLKAFYQKALPMVGWDAYKVINIKYNNQVIGVKNQTLVDSLNTVKEKAKRAAEDSVRAVRMNRVKSEPVITESIVNKADNVTDEKPAEAKPVAVKPAEHKTAEPKPVVHRAVTPKPVTPNPLHIRPR
ncbi:cell division protein FtsQ/DivIB [Mucilaginibacter gilvus]|uniref:cell division protein FtsQ/DivIB n=1 Tax=Mucilaginibacter gilvus TaxID=2305909 RepID=UPI001ABBD539|nr:cell division protein FtsQ [Mucilaginibacter gilvus]